MGIKRLILILAAAVLAVLIALGNYRQARREAYIREFREATQELDLEHKQIEQALYELEERKKARQLCGQGVLVFEEPSQLLVTQVLPLLQNYSYVGMVAIPPDFAPGLGSNLTAEQLEQLTEAGWQFCGRWDGTGSPDAAIASIRRCFREHQLGKLQVLSIAEGGYLPRLDETITATGITTVLHYGESSPLFSQEDVPGTLRHVGCMYWNHPLVLDVLDEAANQRRLLALTVDFSTVFGCYEPELFANMCRILQSHQEIFMVAPLNTPTAEDEQMDAFFRARKEYYESEMARIDEQVRKIYALYDQYGSNMELPGEAG